MVQNKSFSFDDDITPEEYIELMFEKTDEDGILYIPGWQYGNLYEPNCSYRCRLNWNLYDFEKVTNEFNALYSDLSVIAEKYDKLGENAEENKEILGSERLFNVWNTFIRRFETSDFDREKIFEIEDKIDTVNYVKIISQKVADGEEVSDNEKYFLKEYIDLTVSSSEKTVYNKYCNELGKEAEERVGSNICAHSFVVGAARTCRLMSLGAPEAIIKNEARILSAAMVIHKYGISVEPVNNQIRFNLEKRENMTDEELDECSRPMKTNSRKSLAPLFVYLILKKYSSSTKHLRQQEILDYLKQYPFEITVERKALSRIIHNLLDSKLFIYSDKSGTWLEQSSEKIEK